MKAHAEGERCDENAYAFGVGSVLQTHLLVLESPSAVVECPISLSTGQPLQ